MTTSRQLAALAAVDCEIAFDNLTRQLYATDASIYQIEPLAVAFPRGLAEAQAVLRAAAATGVPITPRGAGTGLVGGALGSGLILDLARHNRAITALDLDRRTVRAEAGVVLDQLNAFLKPHGFCFGPDVATSSRATIGGMIANNSSGSHVAVYGVTADHLASLQVLLPDGQTETIGRDSPSLPNERAIVQNVVNQYRHDIQTRMPPGLSKRWPGYGLDRALKEPHNLNHLFCGSEGTLGAIFSAELQIAPLPQAKGVGLLFFSSVADAMQAAVELLDLKPAAIEHIDRVLFDQTRGQLAFKAARDLLELDSKPCESILIVEFFDHVPEKLAALAQRQLGPRTAILKTPLEASLVWNLRKAGLSLLTGCKGPAKPVTGIEDITVRPQQLPAFVAALQTLLKQLHLQACFYGHAAAGLLHVRPVLDLHSANDLRKFRLIAAEAAALVRQFKGSFASEHGVGIARTEFLKDQIGPQLTAACREIKSAFDPRNLFNPGKIIDNGTCRIDSRLRLGAGYQLQLPFTPALAFASRDGSFVANLEQCNGCGGCLKQTPSMCPTFLVTGQEVMSTRGRANAIRAALELRGNPGRDPLRLLELETALQHCLSCKACTSECPSNVNMALLKAELLGAKFKRDGIPPRERILGAVSELGQLGTLFPRLANATLRSPAIRRLITKFLGFSPHRPFPLFAAERFDRWFSKPRPRPHPAPHRGHVFLWDDTFVRFHEPEIGKAAVAVLEAAGFTVTLVKQRRCCGRPAFSQGNLEKARALGDHNLSLLRRQKQRLPPEIGNAPILFLEPSCFSMFVEDYRELSLPGAEEAASRSWLFEDFLDQVLDKNPAALPLRPAQKSIVIHAHCHAKALTQTHYLPRLARRIPGANPALLDTACCGMAGAFGFLESNYDLSLKLAQPLLEQIHAHPPDSIVVASGTSCRHQITHLTHSRPKHLAEVLADHLQIP